MSDYKPHRCDFCIGTVEPIVAKSEPIQVRGAVVLLEGMVIGKCNRCGHRYFPAAVLKRAEQVAQHPEQALRVVHVPVVPAA
jgi:YgiT-type zinc finger domain-containing protein